MRLASLLAVSLASSIISLIYDAAAVLASSLEGLSISFSLAGLGRRQVGNMLEEVLRLAVHLVELALTGVHHILLGFEVLTRVFKLVAGALILALLLVKLKFALLHFASTDWASTSSGLPVFRRR